MIFQEMADADEDRRIDCKALCSEAEGSLQKARYCLENCLHFDISAWVFSLLQQLTNKSL